MLQNYSLYTTTNISKKYRNSTLYHIILIFFITQDHVPNIANLKNLPDPEVRLKCLPFFVTLFTLLKSPISTNIYRGTEQSNVFRIQLTPQQVVNLKQKNSDILVQLRFCLRDNSMSELSDKFPLNLKIIVNGKICDLPNPLPMKPGIHLQKYLPGPVNITHKINHSTQSSVIECKWKKEIDHEYFISCFFVSTFSNEYPIG